MGISNNKYALIKSEWRKYATKNNSFKKQTIEEVENKSSSGLSCSHMIIGFDRNQASDL
jgi:hypothetical protein